MLFELCANASALRLEQGELYFSLEYTSHFFLIQTSSSRDSHACQKRTSHQISQLHQVVTMLRCRAASRQCGSLLSVSRQPAVSGSIRVAARYSTKTADSPAPVTKVEKIIHDTIKVSHALPPPSEVTRLNRDRLQGQYLLQNICKCACPTQQRVTT